MNPWLTSGSFSRLRDAEMIRPTITILRKQSTGTAGEVVQVASSRPSAREPIGSHRSAATMRTDHLGADAWELESDEVLALRRKLAEGHETLSRYSSNEVYYGIKTGLSDVYVIDEACATRLVAEDSRSAELLKPFVQGTHMRPWYVEQSAKYLLAIKSSNDYEWPWSQCGDKAEEVFEANFPAIHAYLDGHRHGYATAPTKADTGGNFGRARIGIVLQAQRFFGLTSQIGHVFRWIGPTCYLVTLLSWFPKKIIFFWAYCRHGPLGST